MSYLSRVEIDYKKPKSQIDLKSVGAFHNWVEQSFPEEWENRERSRKLWRVDVLRGKHYLLIVSDSTPDLRRLETYGVAGTASAKNYDKFLNSLRNGMRMQFRVTLNPVVSISDTPDARTSRGRVVPHVTYAQQMNFLLDRAQKLGFSLNENEFTVIERGYSLFMKSVKPIRLSKAVYQGILTISDADVMRKTLVEGIGKKKAYGFGMMTVIPLG
ncbi:type I-E CRISPR-associated protein Cas6/Cse3/CasE [Arcanobacterium sp. S3PF19]|uniref:type I-E CRISPR-associated protein Cas6/Cse3/CasE n=1 Tax=Arcanobacterium sp. S3PF19 TaxID=1219585 RepID=UPI00050ED2E6|nr:type I-E CRISPR-associated protein Cas6/Cse3/CasE [Arcanobacterium sp. S3PF19]KGF06499.1 CRISPR-associated protein CasE [Arcanobacterium sp. S3PF19]